MSATEQVTMTRAELAGLVRDAHAQGWAATATHRRELEAWESSAAAKRVQAAEPPAPQVWTLPEYAAADAARNRALSEDPNDAMGALAAAVDAAVASVLGDLHDVLTHRQAWRDCIARLSDLTGDDGGTGYYSHELRAYDRTFDHLARLVQRAAGGGPLPQGTQLAEQLQAVLEAARSQLAQLQAAAAPYVQHYDPSWMDRHSGDMSTFARTTYEQARALLALLPAPATKAAPAAPGERALALVGRMARRTRPSGHYATGPLPDDYAEAASIAEAAGL